MRNWFLVFCISSVVWGSYSYDSAKFKNIDIDEVLGNARLVKNYHKCLMEGTPCTPEGDELRKILPDAIRTGCSECTQEQKGAAKKVALKMSQDYAEMWSQLLDKYDPGAVYRQKFAEELKKAGIE